MDEFPALTRDWFALNGCPDPDGAAVQWSRWLSAEARRREPYSDETRLRKALQLATGLSAEAVGKYRNNEPNKVSPLNRERLDSLCEALGRSHPKRAPRPPDVIRRKSARRLALVSDFEMPPSPAYHREVLRGLLRACANSNIEPTLHSVCSDDLRQGLTQLLRTYRPDAMALIRLTPDGKALAALNGAAVPVILVHADRYDYPPPVLVNLVPRQETIIAHLRSWATRLPSSAKVVVVAVKQETPDDRFQPYSQAPVSIRNERIRLSLEALATFRPILCEVPDYTFRQARQVFRAHPDALAYICLSDEVAVALSHLLEVRGAGDVIPRVLGFDGSPLAAEEKITTFGQHLDRLGQVAVCRLIAWFHQQTGETIIWPPFTEEVIDINLIEPDELLKETVQIPPQS